MSHSIALSLCAATLLLASCAVADHVLLRECNPAAADSGAACSIGPAACTSYVDCAADERCAANLCVSCDGEKPACPQTCPGGLEEHTFFRKGCAVCECAPPNLCEQDADCPPGFGCFAGTHCSDDCTEPGCCAGNVCAAKGCVPQPLLPISCAPAGCPATACAGGGCAGGCSGAECVPLACSGPNCAAGACQSVCWPVCKCVDPTQGWVCDKQCEKALCVMSK